MKCTNCGKNNASYHYRYNINGTVTEAHLCPECAAKMAPNMQPAFGGSGMGMLDNMMRSFFNDDFFGGFMNDGFFGRSMFSPMMTFGIPAMILPGVEIRYPSAQPETSEPQTQQQAGVDPELSRKREINALREQMKAAAEAEDYEKAAQLRDQLHKLEKAGGDGQDGQGKAE